MASLVSTFILARGGSSGDIVRVVTAAAEALRGETLKTKDFDETEFWRPVSANRLRSKNEDEIKAQNPDQNLDRVVALVKFFVLE